MVTLFRLIALVFAFHAIAPAHAYALLADTVVRGGGYESRLGPKQPNRMYAFSNEQDAMRFLHNRAGQRKVYYSDEVCDGAQAPSRPHGMLCNHGGNYLPPVQVDSIYQDEVPLRTRVRVIE